MSARDGAAATLPERLLVAVAVATLGLGAWLRFEQVRWPLLFGDEFHSLRLVRQGYLAVLSSFDAFGSGLGLPLLQKLGVDLFGQGHFGIRAVAFVGGLGALVATTRLGRRLGGLAVGLGASVLVALSTFHVYYSGFARSYALVSLVSLLYVGAVTRLTDADRPARTRQLAVVLSAAALPWLHLTALAVVVPVAVAGVVGELLRGRRARAVELLLTHVGAGVLCLLVHLPAWDGLMDFVSLKHSNVGGIAVTAQDVATLLAGGRVASWVAGALLLAGVAGLVQARLPSATPLIAGCLGALAVLAIVRPFGDPYAYSRYLIAVVPLAALIIAWGGSVLLARVGRMRSALVLAACLTLGVGGLLTGPMAPGTPRVARFGATYLSMAPLPAFDATWPATPDIYRRLADDEGVERILEVPYLKNRAQILYRHHALVHGKDVIVGYTPGEKTFRADGPYIELLAPGWRQASGAQRLVVHLDAMTELERYWNFAAKAYRRAGSDPELLAYMRLHIQFGHKMVPAVDAELLDALTAELGEPAERSQTVAVWEL